MKRLSLQTLANETGVPVHYTPKGQILLAGSTIGYIEDFVFLENPGNVDFKGKFYYKFTPEIPDKTPLKNQKYLEMLYCKGFYRLGDLKYEVAKEHTKKEQVFLAHFMSKKRLGENLDFKTPIVNLTRLSTYNITKRTILGKIIIDELHEYGISFADEDDFVPPSLDKIKAKIERTAKENPFVFLDI